MSRSDPFFKAIETRRTYYDLTHASSISDADIQGILERAIKFTPSPFNMQSGRLVLATGQSNKKLWSIVKEHYLESIKDNADQVALHSKKIDEYASGHGTVLFFEDQSVLESWYQRMPHFKAWGCFDTWSQNSTGMLQFAIWTALEVEGLGASLQHHSEYAEPINRDVLKAFDLPGTYKNTALMPFGIPGPSPLREKTFIPVEERVKVVSS